MRIKFTCRRQSELPPELLEIVLARLPAHVLCRCRLVCKRWNDLIAHPGFKSRHAQAQGLRRPYVLISPKMQNLNPRAMRAYKEMHDLGMPVPDSMAKMGVRRDWQILDMAQKPRFYTLSDGAIEKHMRGRRGSCGWGKYTLASDGGLIYAMYWGDDGGGGAYRHVVYNPLGRIWHEIPEPKLWWKDNHNVVVMSVDMATQSYKIISVEAEIATSARPVEVSLYDSTASQWRVLCEVPADHCAWSSVLLKGVFYTLFVDTSAVPWWPRLYLCDLEDGAWSHIDVELPRPSHLQDKSQLVVSLGRLFFVEYTGVPTVHDLYGMTAWETLVANNKVKRKELIKVSISEILLAEKEVIKVTEVPNYPANYYAKYPRRMLDRPQRLIGNPVVAVGCGDSIVISSLLRRRLRFDLVWNRWEELPEDTGPRYAHYERQGIYVGILDLDLREMRELRVTQRIDETVGF